MTDQPTTRAAVGIPLSSLRVSGLLSFGSEVALEFGALTVLVGPNGSGKSNLIDIIRVLRGASGDLQSIFGDAGFEEWLYKGDEEARIGSIEAVVSLPEVKPVRHRLELGPPAQARATVEEVVEYRDAAPGHSEPFYFFKSQKGLPVLNYWLEEAHEWKPRRLKDDEHDRFMSVISQVRDATQHREITRLGRMYDSIRIYSEWTFGRTSPLREATPTDRTDPTLSEAMDDLALALNAQQGTRAHDAIRAILGEIKEGYRDYVTRILFGRVGLELREDPFQRPVPAKRLSDGTLRCLALAAILLNPSPPPLVCIEEPELGMHPDMIRMVADMLGEAASRMQIIVTTHSEHLLTCLQDKFDVLYAFDWRHDRTEVTRLSQEEYTEYRADHALGDLWSSGEIGGVRW